MKEKILIIDDSIIFLETLKDILKDEYVVFALDDEVKAVDMAKKIKPILILLDIVMPRKDGFEIIRELKNEPELADIPVIFLSGLSHEADESKGFTLGAVDYITKPFKPSVVKLRVKMHIELYRNRRMLLSEREYSKILLDLSGDIYWFDYNISDSIAVLSKNYAEFYNVPEIIHGFPETLHYYHLIPESSTEIFQELMEKIKSGIEDFSVEYQVRRYTGELFWHRLIYKLIFDVSGNAVKAIGRIIDITKQKERLEELIEKAETDALTKLFNREEAQLRIERFLAHNRFGEKFAFLVVDLDDFASVNENLGRQFCDTILSDISKKLRGRFRDGDILGRIGGDEFVIFLRGIKDEDAVIAKSVEIREIFRHNFIGHTKNYNVTASIGIAFSPRHGRTYAELYHFAGIALQESKRRGKDKYTVYSEQITNAIARQEKHDDEVGLYSDNIYRKDLVHNVFEMLYETRDLHTTINMVLGIIGKRFHANYCFVMEPDCSGAKFEIMNEWYSKADTEYESKIHLLLTENAQELLAALGSDGICHICDANSNDRILKEAFADISIRALDLCAVCDAGNIKGLIGIAYANNIERTDDESALITYVTRVLSIFVLKHNCERAKHK